MATFYEKMAGVAEKLITKFGADVQVVKRGRTPADVDKPWRGTVKSQDITETVKGAITGFDDDAVDGDIIRRGDLDGWIEAVPGRDITTFDFLVSSEGTRYKILGVRTIKPATTVVAYRLQLRA